MSTNHFNTTNELNGEYNATVAVTYAIFGIFIWDWAVSFWQFELRMIVHRQRFQAPILLYYLNRIVATLFLVFTVVGNAGYSGQASTMMSVSCDRIVQAILAFAVIQASLSSFVLAHRCVALYQMQWWIIILLGVLLSAQVAMAIPVITTVPWTKGFPKGAAACSNALTISDFSHLYCAINYALTAVVDITVYVLTMAKLSQRTNGGNGNKSSGMWAMMSAQNETLGSKSIMHLLFQHSTMAILLTLLFNMPVMILEFVHLNGQAVYIPYNIGVPANAMISCHIIMALYNWNRPDMSRGLFTSAGSGKTLSNSSNLSDFAAKPVSGMVESLTDVSRSTVQYDSYAKHNGYGKPLQVAYSPSRNNFPAVRVQTDIYPV